MCLLLRFEKKLPGTWQIFGYKYCKDYDVQRMYPLVQEEKYQKTSGHVITCGHKPSLNVDKTEAGTQKCF